MLGDDSGGGAPGEVRTGRLVLSPVRPADGPEIAALKADPRVHAMMLGGVRTQAQSAVELAADMAYWAARGVGIWTVRAASSAGGDPGPLGGPRLLGLTGLHDRPDGLGTALRFAFYPECRGQGLAREAAGAALRYAHERAGLRRVVAVARESNLGSRLVLGAIGMYQCGRFLRDGEPMLLFESRAS